MRRITLLTALALTAAVGSPAAGQRWQPIGTPDNSNTGAYWNNASDDNVGGAVCNVGAILTNTPALTNASCSNQRPPTLLPMAPRIGPTGVFLGKNGGSNPGGFLFAAGTYFFDEIGRVAGNTSTTWGVITTNGTLFTSAQLMSGSSVAITGPFAIWMTLALPAAANGAVFTSNMQVWNGSAFSAIPWQQFVVFSSTENPGNDGILPGGAINLPRQYGEYYIGMEDNVNGGRGFDRGGSSGVLSDRDYNDVIIMVRTFNTPEPQAWALMALGLAATSSIAALRRRA